MAKASQSAADRVRRDFGKKYGGSFIERPLTAGRTIKGRPVTKKFDTVSEDGRTVAMAKACSTDGGAGCRTGMIYLTQASLDVSGRSDRFRIPAPPPAPNLDKIGAHGSENGLEVGQPARTAARSAQGLST